MKYFTNLFLTIESKARAAFEHFPFIHAFFAGIGMVLFWRGVWETADILEVGTVASIVVGGVMLGAIGLFLQTFVGNTIIIKEVAKDKQMTKKVEIEIKEEEVTMVHLAERLRAIEEKLDSLNSH